MRPPLFRGFLFTPGTCTDHQKRHWIGSMCDMAEKILLARVEFGADCHLRQPPQESKEDGGLGSNRCRNGTMFLTLESG